MSNNQGGYGSLTPSSQHENGNGPGENQPLLGRKPSSNSVVTRIRRSMMADVDRSWGDVVLVLCYLITGLLDSASISIWGSFVSMQTGESSSTRPAILCGMSLMGS
jgi:hypothetical protein